MRTIHQVVPVAALLVLLCANRCAAADDPVIIDSMEESVPKSTWYSENDTTTGVLEPTSVPTVESDSITVEPDEPTEAQRALLSQLETEELEKRKQKEALVRVRISKARMVAGNSALSDAENVYYLCIGDVDYAVTPSDQMVYSVMISKKGDYFVSSEGISDETKAAILEKATEEYLSSTEYFWNKVTLMYNEGVSISSLPRDAFGVMCVPYYNQGAGYWEGGTWTHTDWPAATFSLNGHSLHSAGCGFFSTAMAMSYIRQAVISPVDFKENGQYTGNGSAVTVGVESARMYGINAWITSDWSEVLSALADGHPVMAHVGPSIFTNNGHYILLIGLLPDGSIAVNDPGHASNSYWYCGVSFPQETVIAAANNRDRSTAFTIFG
ncbi:MAG: C39 family peptidase [Eubacteriales bacterium]|nr:C39 family peptidase [Eubacteriales bacterium]